MTTDDGLDGPPRSDQPAANDGLQYFRPVRLRKAADVVVDILVDAIRGGIYSTGDRFPRERDLAARLDVSRTTLREATAILQRAGVVDVKRGAGGGVIVVNRLIPPGLLGGGSEMLSRTIELRSLLEVRRSLEMLGCVLAVHRATTDEIEELCNLVDRLEMLKALPLEFLHVDWQIHMQVVALGHNPVLTRVAGQLFEQQATIRDEYPFHAGDTFNHSLAVQLHREMLAALSSRDEDRAMAVLDRHLALAEERILGQRLDQIPAPGPLLARAD
jgi:GntR family transcriptional repressor for pyruvate dehydrogenase complex